MHESRPRVLLVIGGGIAAYKSCELVRLIRKGGADVTCVVTEGGQQFVTPMALAALSENPVHTSLWDLKNEAEMGHIQLSREADLVVVCPATADLLAKMATGIADDLATTLILATDKPVVAVPAMNVRMWEHETTKRNVETLGKAEVTVLDPDEGPMACGEFGYGRLPEPDAIWARIAPQLGIAIETPAETDAGSAEAGLAEAEEAESDSEADVEALVEDEGAEELEEQDEESESLIGGLGGLIASIIPRSTPKRSAEEIEAEYLEEPEEPQDPAPEQPDDDSSDEEGDGESGDGALSESGEPLDDIEPDLSAPILAVKGSANSAPPIDAGAINHEVDARKSAPEPVNGDAQPGANADVGEELGDALEGEEFAAGEASVALEGRHIVVTAGPTWEAIDPVRYIANRSSGRQGFAIAAAAAALGGKVTLIAGPVALKTPLGVERIDVESAAEMSDAVKRAMPADAAVMVAAVADWRPKEYREEKLKKRGSAPPALVLTENPDILTNLASAPNRPTLVIGFAAETEDVIENAKKKRKRKVCDWIVANDVSGPRDKSVMGGNRNRVHIIDGEGVETLDEMPKSQVAMILMERVAQQLDEDVQDG